MKRLGWALVAPVAAVALSIAGQYAIFGTVFPWAIVVGMAFGWAATCWDRDKRAGWHS